MLLVLIKQLLHPLLHALFALQTISVLLQARLVKQLVQRLNSVPLVRQLVTHAELACLALLTVREPSSTVLQAPTTYLLRIPAQPVQ